MRNKRILVVVGLLVVGLVAAATLAYSLWATSASDCPTLIYFRADL